MVEKFEVGKSYRRNSRGGFWSNTSEGKIGDTGTIMTVTSIQTSAGGIISCKIGSNSYTNVSACPEFFDEVSTISFCPSEHCYSDGLFGELSLQTITQVFNYGDKTMELKDIKTDNLKEAKKQFEDERKNEEVEFAKKEFRRAKDNIDRLDREIKALTEQKKPFEEILSKFR